MTTKKSVTPMKSRSFILGKTPITKKKTKKRPQSAGKPSLAAYSAKNRTGMKFMQREYSAGKSTNRSVAFSSKVKVREFDKKSFVQSPKKLEFEYPTPSPVKDPYSGDRMAAAAQFINPYNASPLKSALKNPSPYKEANGSPLRQSSPPRESSVIRQSVHASAPRFHESPSRYDEMSA